ncbi:hypothetical protein [Roseibium sp. MMSF_3544]|uniref:hypothetical protein n=1 Tax=unclassified Roseibium TaxID=2629323 RepID=UPI00273F6EF3|nr:hypothetical protein [Roseibium sp. MMSF_3544]
MTDPERSPPFTPVRNPTEKQIEAILKASSHNAARQITDPRTGDVYVWPFEQADHATGAKKLLVPYNRPPGDGDVLTLD